MFVVLNNAVSARVSGLYTLPHVYTVVSRLHGHNSILTLKVNPDKTPLRTNLEGICATVWDPDSQFCSDLRPGT